MAPTKATTSRRVAVRSGRGFSAELALLRLAVRSRRRLGHGVRPPPLSRREGCQQKDGIEGRARSSRPVAAWRTAAGVGTRCRPAAATCRCRSPRLQTTIVRANGTPASAAKRTTARSPLPARSTTRPPPRPSTPARAATDQRPASIQSSTIGLDHLGEAARSRRQARSRAADVAQVRDSTSRIARAPPRPPVSPASGAPAPQRLLVEVTAIAAHGARRHRPGRSRRTLGQQVDDLALQARSTASITIRVLRRRCRPPPVP